MDNNRFDKFAQSRHAEQQAILDGGTSEKKKAGKEATASDNIAKGKEGKQKKTTQKKAKAQVSKKMEDNQAAVMFYLPEDVKLDLSIYAKKHKKAVAEILRELVVEKIYS